MILARIALALSLIALLLLLVGGPGYRLDLWGLGFGLLGALRYALYFGAAGAVLAIVGLLVPSLRSGRAFMLSAALVLGVVAAMIPVGVRQMAASKPFIHDVTTDLENPPEFVAVAPLRADAPNPAEYGGEEVAEQQRQGYPDLGPERFEASPERVFEAAENVARTLGWEIVAAVPEDGRIEATDTTLWYGFEDDVVIRIRDQSGATRVDVRSKSRVGGSDLGKNAARIRAFLEALRARLSVQG
ncbi:MAG: DUF1499 domain-containing protein [Wenzhouxiangellaceae bacterium]|nr:DUF1499 domain-containing protein [Wenzhouxiangellaceae bacterium]